MNALKILQVGSSLTGWGGIEKYVLRLSSGLRERGHTVDIVCPNNSWLKKQADSAEFNTIPIKLLHQHDISKLPALIRLLRKEKYDIIHTHLSTDYLITALASKYVRSNGLLMTRHVPFAWKGFKRKLYANKLYPKIIAVSNAVRNTLIASRINENKIVTVYAGIEIPEIQPEPAAIRQELGIADDVTLIGIVARVTKVKGHWVLMEAMRNVDERAVLVVVGSGEEEAPLRSYVELHGLKDRVFFLGYREDIDRVTMALDIIVQPSVWEEAFPLSILECMALGKPIIATHGGGVPEMLIHEESGLLVPKDNARALSEAINVLINNPPIAAKMGDAALKRQREEFTIPKMAEATEQVYLSLLAGEI